jgi:hypothetical protein
MINQLKKELAPEKLEIMKYADLLENLGGIQEIIFDEFTDGLPQNYDAGEFYLNNLDYTSLIKIEKNIQAKIEQQASHVKGLL